MVGTAKMLLNSILSIEMDRGVYVLLLMICGWTSDQIILSVLAIHSPSLGRSLISFCVISAIVVSDVEFSTEAATSEG